MQGTLITDASVRPWRRICRLLVTHGPNTFLGTAFLVTNRRLLTAGHNTFAPGAVPTNIRVEAIVSPHAPAGHSTLGIDSKRLPGWDSSQDPERDAATVMLADPIGDQVGWFGTRVHPREDLIGRKVQLAGFPATVGGGQQLVLFETTIVEVRDGRIYYVEDLRRGCSGSPVWYEEDGQHWVVGIHAGGTDRSPPDLSHCSSATRITEAVQALFTGA